MVARLDVIWRSWPQLSAMARGSDAVRIDRLARLEKLRRTAAVQAAECGGGAPRWGAARRGHPDAIGRGIAEQIGLACRISPSVAARRLSRRRRGGSTCLHLQAGS